jgi:hypothetical protein
MGEGRLVKEDEEEEEEVEEAEAEVVVEEDGMARLEG